MSITNSTVTLQTAILNVLTEFLNSNKTFSVHDITRSIREKCNLGLLEIPDLEDHSGSDTHRFNIPHVKVRDSFNEMRDDGTIDSLFVLTRNFNGTYFDYTVKPLVIVNPSTNFTPVDNSGTISFTPTTAVSSNDEIRNRVRSYLNNCKVRNYTPSVKNIQSAIKRGSKSTGTTSDSLVKIVTDLGYAVQYKSASNSCIFV